jgi:hypothetical protein
LLFEINPSANSHMPWLWLAPAALGASLLTILGYVKKAATLVAAASVASALLLSLIQVRGMILYNFDLTSVGLWFFVVFVVAIVEAKIWSKAKLAEPTGWSRLVGTLFVAVLFFAQNYYPHMKASWGGGAAVNVTIYFSKDSPISPNKTVLAQLVEESDEGYYIVGPKETRAIYVPRSAVALVYFSDKVADSPLLRDSK